ncbi:class I SAM-dependent methyltransferase (plasmid) [Streptomyces sp. NBC_01724]|uniref:class I SAM-dependent methyltransferase n=1 Tax=Streptomyces sp. NBC_01724 TaxID=2975922 RepID=UPI002E3333F8|nr:class I SAM-dependent methyltransferase [Streptomyces sp. NBC_01724]
MTYPNVPEPALPPKKETLFGAAAADYARYRPGVPDAAIRLLADTLRGRPAPAVLDLGTGTGQVPLALLTALPSLAHIEAVDVSQRMLDQARNALAPALNRCTLTLVHATADAYAPLAPLSGREAWAPDLVTCCRAFHWMNRPAVLTMADRVAAPHATIAIMGDGSLWTHEADWTTALRELIQSYLGPARRAGARAAYASPSSRYEDVLAESAFSDITKHDIPLARSWTPNDVIGYLRTTSFAQPSLFTGRHDAFEGEALALLDAYAPGGALQEDAVFTVLLARRPGSTS